jgi:release factor glutamine methyltransferase
VSADDGTARVSDNVGSDEAWTILRMILWSADYLAEKGVENSRLDAEWLLADALEVARLQLYLEYDRPLSPEERAAFKPLLRRRAGREPLQYILGRTAFRELDLMTDARVLVPRPETEVLVEEVLGWAAARLKGLGTVLELGTGSGAVALSLAVEGTCGRIVATDISSEALEVAVENARRHDAAEKVEFRQGGLFEALEREERFDVVVSNPPYVEDGQRPDLQPEVSEWEPAGALFAGPDGLEVIRPLVAGAAERVLPEGLLALEVGTGQESRVVELIEETRAFGPAQVRRDLSGRPRVVLAERNRE